MNEIKSIMNKTFKYIKPFVKWLFFAILVGIIGGVIGAFFHKCLEIATKTREANLWLILFLPLAGLLITLLYSAFKNKGNLNTNRVLEAVETDERVPFSLSPLIFISTLITHLFGGSAGREGAALQLGGSLGYNIGKLFKLSKNDRRIIVMVGMSSFFSAMFGAPLTAAIFSLEVIRVGYVRHCGFLPCIMSAIVAYEISKLFGTCGIRFLVDFPGVTPEILVKIIILSVLCAIIGILFCVAIRGVSFYMHKFFRNPYIRTIVGSLIIVGLTMILKTTDYNGAGMHMISQAMEGTTKTWAFAYKIIFTAITIAAGFKGGEIVPTLFIGSTFGCIMGPVIGLDASFAASIGFVAMFCGVVNCPFASVALALEVFGADGITVYALACAVSFMMSGNFSIYKSQKIEGSKIAYEEITE